MLLLEDSLGAWGTPSFEQVLKQELSRQAEELPLQQALVSSSSVTDSPITVVLKGLETSAVGLRVRVGIFFQGVIGGCSCADDPTPMQEVNEYCDLQLDIDKMTAVTVITLLD